MSGLSFDYHRPTVSEFSVTATTDDYADLTIHPDSAYEVVDGEICWLGEGLCMDSVTVYVPPYGIRYEWDDRCEEAEERPKDCVQGVHTTGILLVRPVLHHLGI